MAKEEPIHTFLDDIKYQMVKEDNKRTTFYSSEIQILNKNKQTIEKLERTKMHVRSEYNRQQVILENQLGKLLLAKKELGLVSSRQNRRHSVPHGLHLATQSTGWHTHSALCAQDKHSLHGHMTTAAKPSELKTNAAIHVSSTRKLSKPVLQDLRRGSHDSNERAQRGCPKRNSNIKPEGRRATIAEGVASRDLLTSPEFIPNEFSGLSRLRLY